MSDTKRIAPGWLLPAGLLALVVVLVAIALSREPLSLDAAEPEGVVQEYLQAIRDERWDNALSLVHPDWLGECTADEIEAYVATDFTASLGADESFGGVVSEHLGDIEEGLGGKTAPVPTETVEVTISHRSAGGLGSSWTEFVTFELTDDSGDWLLAADPWPYFTWSCREG